MHWGTPTSVKIIFFCILSVGFCRTTQLMGRSTLSSSEGRQWDGVCGVCALGRRTCDISRKSFPCSFVSLWANLTLVSIMWYNTPSWVARSGSCWTGHTQVCISLLEDINISEWWLWKKKPRLKKYNPNHNQNLSNIKPTLNMNIGGTWSVSSLH